MTRAPVRAAAAALSALLVLLAGGCGDGGHPTVGASTTPTPAPTYRLPVDLCATLSRRLPQRLGSTVTFADADGSTAGAHAAACVVTARGDALAGIAFDVLVQARRTADAATIAYNALASADYTSYVTTYGATVTTHRVDPGGGWDAGLRTEVTFDATGRDGRPDHVLTTTAVRSGTLFVVVRVHGGSVAAGQVTDRTILDAGVSRALLGLVRDAVVAE